MDGERVTLQEAARRLGISEGAVRKRVKRGTLTSDKTGDGRILVHLEAATPGADVGADAVLHPHTETLVSELRDRVRYLEEESRRKDHIIAGLVERIPPQLEAPSEATERLVEPTPSEPSRGQQESTERRPWWRRMFGA